MYLVQLRMSNTFLTKLFKRKIQNFYVVFDAFFFFFFIIFASFYDLSKTYLGNYNDRLFDYFKCYKPRSLILNHH